MKDVVLYCGTFIDTPTASEFRIRENHVIAVVDGVIEGVFDKTPQEYKSIRPVDLGDAIVIPPFIDLHVHAPQHMQMGAGLDLRLLDWLENYTFPNEARFADPDYARELYPLFAGDLKRQGSLRAVVFGTIHEKACELLCEALDAEGLSAFVGKVNMDQNAPDSLLEDSDASYRGTVQFCEKFADHNSIKPIVTPRFAPTCSEGLMKSLGTYAKDNGLTVQYHLSETIREAKWVAELFPDSRSYTELYDECGLLGKGTLMAHGIFLSDGEIELISKRGSTLVHCPSANINLSSGIMPLTRYMDAGVKLGLGSDVGAGHSLGMNRAIVQAVQSSKLLKILQPEKDHRTAGLSEAFYLATAGNGKFFADNGMAECGVFEKEMSFDALCVASDAPESAGLSALSKLERFVYSGDDRNIEKRILAGREI